MVLLFLSGVLWLALTAFYNQCGYETCLGYDCAGHYETEGEIPTDFPPPGYQSGAVVVMCADTGLVLYGYEHHTPLYPASVTKVMTALVVLDHLREIQELDERFFFSHHAVFSIPRNSSHIYMDVGESLSVYEALYALMLSSANEVSLGLAEHVAGTVEEFVHLMNLRAMSLGAVNTHFANPSGLPAVGHVTTAYDMALIMREAVRLYPIFVNIIATRRFDIPPTERQSETRHLLTTNQMIRQGPYFNPDVVGGKTGWTHAAGNTLVTYAEREGRRLIITVLQGTGTSPYRDTAALMDFAFAIPQVERVVFHAASYTRSIPVYQEIDGEQVEIERLTLQATQDITHTLPANLDMTALRFNLTVPEYVTAPITEGEPLGRVVVYAQNVRLGSVSLLAQSDVTEMIPKEAEGEYTPVAEEADYAALLYLPTRMPPDNFLEMFREGEYLSELAIPLIISFAGLLISFVLYALRRKRKMNKLFHIGSGNGTRYTHPYRYR